MRSRIHVLRSDGSELHLQDVTDLFDLVADGLAGADDLLIADGKPPRLLCAVPDLKWAFVAASMRPTPYATYQMADADSDVASADDLVDLDDEDCEIVGEWSPAPAP